MSKINFNLCCLVINSVIVKLFLDFSGGLVYENGSAACLSLILSVIFFLIIVGAVWKLREPICVFLEKSGVKKFVYTLLAAYFICGAVYYVYSVSRVLGGSAYIGVSRFAAAAVILIAVLIIARGGKGPLFKLCGLCVPVIAFGLAAITLNAAGHCDPYSAAPALGNGAGVLAASAFKNVFAFSEILLPAAYMLVYKEERESRGIFASILIALALYAAYYIVLFLAVPRGMSELGGRSMARFSGMSRLNMRLDAVNIIISAASAVLYLSAEFIIIGKLLGDLGFKKITNAKKAAVLLLPLMLLPLAGCGAAREVENTAYVIAVGIDAAESDGYNFTLQFSNPLSSGSDTDATVAERDASADKEQEEGGEKPTNNLILAAPNIYEAVEDSKSYLGKSPALSHLKLIVFSDDVLKSGAAAELCGSFLGIDEVRPETKLCTAESAKDYLTEVEPSLEESAARYYELLFSEKSAVGGLETNLIDFNSRVSGIGSGAVMPIVSKDGIGGGIVFNGRFPAVRLSGDECRLVNSALGRCDEELFFTSENGMSYSIKGKRPYIEADASNGEINGTARLCFMGPESASGFGTDQPKAEFERKIRAVFEKIYAEGADIFEFKKRVRLDFRTEKQYNAYMESDPKIKMDNLEINFIAIN